MVGDDDGSSSIVPSGGLLFEGLRRQNGPSYQHRCTRSDLLGLGGGDGRPAGRAGGRDERNAPLRPGWSRRRPLNIPARPHRPAPSLDQRHLPSSKLRLASALIDTSCSNEPRDPCHDQSHSKDYPPGRAHHGRQSLTRSSRAGGRLPPPLAAFAPFVTSLTPLPALLPALVMCPVGPIRTL